MPCVALLSNEDVAKIIHAAIVAYCKVIGDNSQPPWDDVSDYQKEIAVKAVEFYREHPEENRELVHNKWFERAIERGWKYGPEKNESKKESPGCVLHKDLPIEQISKDAIFEAIIKVFA